MAEKAVRLEEALSLALSLSPVDRLKLVERVVSSVESEMSAGQPLDTSATSGTWGAEVVALLDQLDLTDWEHIDIPDAGEWVHQLRRQDSERHWKGDE
jgi:hypothetical protein